MQQNSSQREEKDEMSLVKKLNAHGAQDAVDKISKSLLLKLSHFSFFLGVVNFKDLNQLVIKCQEFSIVVKKSSSYVAIFVTKKSVFVLDLHGRLFPQIAKLALKKLFGSCKKKIVSIKRLTSPKKLSLHFALLYLKLLHSDISLKTVIKKILSIKSLSSIKKLL